MKLHRGMSLIAMFVISVQILICVLFAPPCIPTSFLLRLSYRKRICLHMSETGYIDVGDNGFKTSVDLIASLVAKVRIQSFISP